LVVGYDESDPFAPSTRAGSHNLVVGAGHSYDGHGGLVTGYRNKVSGAYTAVVGGTQNAAGVEHAVVVGGLKNLSSGTDVVVVGGLLNVADADRAAVFG